MAMRAFRRLSAAWPLNELGDAGRVVPVRALEAVVGARLIFSSDPVTSILVWRSPASSSPEQQIPQPTHNALDLRKRQQPSPPLAVP